MTKDCTGGETTTGVLKSKGTVNFLNGVFETATMDKMFGCEHDGEPCVRVRTQPILLS